MSSVTAKYAVVIPSHRRPEMLKRAVRSVFHQTLAPQAVFLIVDEEDNREAYSFLKTFDKRLHLEFTGGGFGGAKARNVGLDLIAEEDFEYIFFLDDDDEWLPNKVECQIQRLLDEPDAICVTCWNYKVGNETVEVRRPVQSLLNKQLSMWNTIGSFSFFGYRLNGETKALRLWGDLEASQDWEFYLRMRAFGTAVVVEDFLVEYAAHSAPKISGNAAVKLRSLQAVYGRNRNHLSLRERMIQQARIHMIASEGAPAVCKRIYHACAAIVLALASGVGDYGWVVARRSAGSMDLRIRKV